jgi:hypothetical protein
VNFWVTSIAVPIGVAGATSVVAQLTFGPRLAARSAHIQAWHTARAQLADDLVKVMLTCSALESADRSNPRTASESDRWEAQLDELTTRLADDGPAIALTHPSVLGTPVLIAQCFGAARGVWLSGKPLPQRAAELKEVVGPVQQLYGRRWWHIPANIARMRATVAKYS